MFFKNPFMSAQIQSEFKRVFKKHTNIAGGSTKIYRDTRQHANVFGFEILLNSLRSDIYPLTGKKPTAFAVFLPPVCVKNP